jgi:hypothetical protein
MTMHSPTAPSSAGGEGLTKSQESPVGITLRGEVSQERTLSVNAGLGHAALTAWDSAACGPSGPLQFDPLRQDRASAHRSARRAG